MRSVMDQKREEGHKYPYTAIIDHIFADVKLKMPENRQSF